MLIRLIEGVWAKARKEENVKKKKSRVFFTAQLVEAFSKVEQEFLKVKSFS